MLSQVRRSVRGSWARYFQKLLTSGTPRVALMSSKTARTSGLASAYSIGCIGLSPPGLVQARKIGGARQAPTPDHRDGPRPPVVQYRSDDRDHRRQTRLL